MFKARNIFFKFFSLKNEKPIYRFNHSVGYVFGRQKFRNVFVFFPFLCVFLATLPSLFPSLFLFSSFALFCSVLFLSYFLFSSFSLLSFWSLFLCLIFPFDSCQSRCVSRVTSMERDRSERRESGWNVGSVIGRGMCGEVREATKNGEKKKVMLFSLTASISLSLSLSLSSTNTLPFSFFLQFGFFFSFPFFLILSLMIFILTPSPQSFLPHNFFGNFSSPIFLLTHTCSLR